MGWLRFNEEAPASPKAVTKQWGVWGGVRLATVKWYAPWRRYAMFPEPGTLFEKDCLREIATFLEDETNKRKQERKK